MKCFSRLPTTFALLLVLHSRVEASSQRKSLRSVDYHRQLGFGWSWTNLMFKLGVCHTPSSTCPEYSSNSCGCPDCSKHLIPPHLHAYCSALEDSGSSNNQGESDDSVSYTKDTTEESYFGDRSVGGQSTTRVFKLWMVVAMGFAILALVVGVASRRLQEKQTSRSATDYKLESEGGFTGVGKVLLGMSLVGVAGSFSRTSSDRDDESSMGVVSRRLGLLSSGAAVEPVDTTQSDTPAFIQIPANGRMTTNVVDADDNGCVEVEGPCSPSSY